MRSLFLRSNCLLLTVLICVLSLSAHAQLREPNGAAISGGIYAALGLQNEHSSQDSNFDNAILMLGAYIKLPRVRFQPGLDLRCLCGDNGVQGMMVGPRFSASFGSLHPYAEAVIGPANDYYVSSPNLAGSQVHGVATLGVVGVDLETGGHVHWRIVDVSFGSFSGVTHATPVTIATGILFTIP